MAKLLDALCAAVAAKYDGDAMKAGVVVSKIQHFPPRFYASVCRYKDRHTRDVVCAAGHDEKCTTAHEAVRALAQKWYDANRPASVRDALEELGTALAVTL